MEIRITKINTRVLAGNASGVINTYRVIEEGNEFLLNRTVGLHGSSLSMAGKEGILYVDSQDNKVHRQIVALGGSCGLNTDDVVVEGLSPESIRALVAADEINESKEITISVDEGVKNEVSETNNVRKTRRRKT